MIGQNTANAELKKRALALADLLDQVAELQGEIKILKAAAKEDGYDMKAFAQIVKEQRRGVEYQAAQLELELVLDTYRTAMGLPVTLDAAQERVSKAAGEVQEPRREAKGRKSRERLQ